MSSCAIAMFAAIIVAPLISYWIMSSLCKLPNVLGRKAECVMNVQVDELIWGLSTCVLCIAMVATTYILTCR